MVDRLGEKEGASPNQPKLWTVDYLTLKPAMDH